jgi:hypothetical protein
LKDRDLQSGEVEIGKILQPSLASYEDSSIGDEEEETMEKE